MTGQKKQVTIARLGNALGLVSADRFIAVNPTDRHNVAGRVTAITMSRMARTEGAANNRVIALVHVAGQARTLHVWSFPSIDKDFNTGRGHMSIPLDKAVDSLETSPHYAGLLLVTNKNLGKILVFALDLANKLLLEKQVLTVEKVNSELATHLPAQFGESNAIIAGVNDLFFCFRRITKKLAFNLPILPPTNISARYKFTTSDLSTLAAKARCNLVRLSGPNKVLFRFAFFAVVNDDVF